MPVKIVRRMYEIRFERCAGLMAAVPLALHQCLVRYISSRAVARNSLSVVVVTVAKFCAFSSVGGGGRKTRLQRLKGASYSIFKQRGTHASSSTAQSSTVQYSNNTNSTVEVHWIFSSPSEGGGLVGIPHPKNWLGQK